MTINNIISLQEYDNLLSDHSKIHYIKITSSTCAPCKMMSPLFEKLAEELKNNTNLAFYSLLGDFNDETLKLVKKLNITSVPSFLVITEGEININFSGAIPYTKLKEKLGIN